MPPNKCQVLLLIIVALALFAYSPVMYPQSVGCEAGSLQVPGLSQET